MWFGGLAGKGEEEVCWEIWTLDVTIATPRTESGKSHYPPLDYISLYPTHTDEISFRTSKSPQSNGKHASKSRSQNP